MATLEEEPVMLPFQDKVGTGWHVVIRYHEGHERRIEGFATENEAVDWITANQSRSISSIMADNHSPTIQELLLLSQELIGD